MTSRDFIYWLQGFFEIADPKQLTEEQLKMIKNHLALVFKHEIDPLIDGGNALTAQELQDIHDANLNLHQPKPPHLLPPTGTLYRC